MIGFQEALFHHIKNSTWSSDYDVDSLLENSNFIPDDGSSNTSVHFNLNELTDCLHDISNLLSELSSGCDDQSLSVD